MKRSKKAIVWFRWDLRIEDKEALFKASILAEEIIPIKIFIPSFLEKFGKRKDRLRYIYCISLKSLKKT
jgi:deoxyribodipyrimidine photolyase